MIYCAPSTQSQLPKKIICAHPPPPHPHSPSKEYSSGRSTPLGIIKIKEVIKAAGICKSGGIYKGAPYIPTVPQLEGYFANRYWHHWRTGFFFVVVVVFSHPDFSKLTKQLWWSIWMMKLMSTHSGKAGQPTQILWSKTRVNSQRKESLSLDQICCTWMY